MKARNKVLAILFAAVLTASFAACGGQPSGGADTGSASASSGQGEETDTAATPDLSNPSIVVEYGDDKGIEELGSKAQNFEIEEGTVVKISGYLSTNFSNPSIMEERDGGGIGITMYVDGDWEMPEDKTDIEAVGVFKKGQYTMEFHVDPENITLL